MKIITTSDLHGRLPEIPECDLLLIAGDLCPDYFHDRPNRLMNKGEQRQRHWLDTEFRKWLDDIPAKQVVGIAGNHDYVFEHQFLIPEGLRWTYLCDELAITHGLRIWGTPYVPHLPRWAFHLDDRGLEARAQGIPEGIDILLSHGPPYEYLDCVDERYGGPKPVGDIWLAMELYRIQPKVFVCGHIHEQGGKEVIHPDTGTVIRNASLVNIDYEPVNLPKLLHI